MAVSFCKMHGLGNDFILLDARTAPLSLTPERVRRLSDRGIGIGCDQLIVLEPSMRADAALFMRIYNSDGSLSGACGNAARCVARILLSETGAATGAFETAAGLLACARTADGLYTVDMGPPRLDWADIPLAVACDTLALPLAVGPLSGPTACSMGNPHATFFVDAVDAVEIERFGPLLEHDPIFPQRANIGVAQIIAPNVVRLRVWERGAGLTRACGSGACAAGVAAMRRGLTGPRVRMILDGGELTIGWRGPGFGVEMTGPAAAVCVGEIAAELWDA